MKPHNLKRGSGNGWFLGSLIVDIHDSPKEGGMDPNQICGWVLLLLCVVHLSPGWGGAAFVGLPGTICHQSVCCDLVKELKVSKKRSW